MQNISVKYILIVVATVANSYEGAWHFDSMEITGVAKQP